MANLRDGRLGLSLQFGEIDIDGSLVASQQQGAEELLMLNNGCLCCTVRGDLVRMISDLVRTKKDKFDHIIIETTGKSVLRT
jgi:G3E family GTPase